jgi:protein-S-isoprenylcysteine O-methyltransferase Ste14
MENTENKSHFSYPVMLIKIYALFFVVSASIYAMAGRLNYWQGWLFCGITLILLVITSVKFVDRKDLMRERFKSGPGVKWWDRIFFIFHIIFVIALFDISVYDGGRFHWSPQLPVVVYIVAYIIFLASYSFILWSMLTNNFFSRNVRIQSDRGQYVVQDGPYSFVRHPGYLGMILVFLSMPIVFGSLWGLIPACLDVIAFIIRTYLEDKMLQKELPGYSDYAKKVPYRLMRGIW